MKTKFLYLTNNKVKEFKIYNGGFVNSEKGTGIVHIALAFGEDDFNLCKSQSILDQRLAICFIDSNGNLQLKYLTIQDAVFSM